MPVLTNYPGVYIEEISSGVHTITGVATSITAFVGRTLRGPTDTATTVNSFADFERTFGGLWLESALAFAVRDFFLNGGGQAIIVRCFNPAAGSFATMSIGDLDLEAAWPGSWANQLRVRIDYATRPLPDKSADPDLFNLTVKDIGTGQTEIFRNLVIIPGQARRVDTVLANESLLIRATAVPAARPAAHADIAAGENTDPFSNDFAACYTAIAAADQARSAHRSQHLGRRPGRSETRNVCAPRC